MRHLTLTALSLLVCGCTSMWPVEQSAETLRRQIASEGLLAPGDEVRIFDADGTMHELKITNVDLAAGTVAGKAQAVDIASIVALEKRGFSPIKTGILVGGLVLGLLSADCEGPDCDDGGIFPACC
jgi:hypothetical protein